MELWLHILKKTVMQSSVVGLYWHAAEFRPTTVWLVRLLQRPLILSPTISILFLYFAILNDNDTNIFRQLISFKYTQDAYVPIVWVMYIIATRVITPPYIKVKISKNKGRMNIIKYELCQHCIPNRSTVFGPEFVHSSLPYISWGVYIPFHLNRL